MRGHLKRLGMATALAVVTVTLATTSATAARPSEPGTAAPQKQPADRCHALPPDGDEWHVSNEFSHTDRRQACMDCLAHAASLRNDLTDEAPDGTPAGPAIETHCWEPNVYEATLYYRLAPPPEAPPAYRTGYCVPREPTSSGWTLMNVYFHWEAGRSCRLCTDAAMALVDVLYALPLVTWEGMNYYCWESTPYSTFLYIKFT